MNVIFDCNVEISPELQAALHPLLPEGSAPIILDAMQGLKGTPNEREGVVFVTRLPSDVLRYHGSFFEKYKHVPQWFMILLNEKDHGVRLLKNAGTKYNLQNCKIYQINDVEELKNTVPQILKSRIIVPGKVLLLSKHKKASVQELAALLFHEDQEKYDIRISANAYDTNAAILLLCGQEEKDFVDVSIPEGMEPYFVLLNPEREVQQFLDPESLLQRIASVYNMTVERVEDRLFFISVKAEQWKRTPSAGLSAIEQGILMWDAFGLPVSRKMYTMSDISGFLDRTYSDVTRLEALLV